MNTELDGNLAVWGGRIMLIVGIFGWSWIPLFFLGNINLFSEFLRGDGILGLGAIIGAVFGGIGGSIVIKTKFYKQWKKEKTKNPCLFYREHSRHDMERQLHRLQETPLGFEIPEKCRVCTFEHIVIYHRWGKK